MLPDWRVYEDSTRKPGWVESDKMSALVIELSHPEGLLGTDEEQINYDSANF